jgi:integrase
MGSIEKRTQAGTVRYRAHYIDPAGKQRSKSFPLKKQAESYLTGVESAKLTGQYVDPTRGKVTLGDLADDWLALKAGIRPSTRARYVSAVETHIRPRWGTTPLTRIDNEAIQRWLVDDLIKSGQGPGSIHKITRVMSGILAKAVRDRRIAINPAHGLELPTPNPKRRRYLTVDQVEMMAAAAFDLDGESARAQIHVFGYCGPRPAELAGLRVRAVDVRGLRLEIVETITNVNGKLIPGPPKDYERRSIPVPATVMTELIDIIAGKAPDDLVFEGPRGGPWRNSTIRRAWFNDAAIAAGVPKLVPYELRHTAASLAVSAGANVLAVSRMLGHADPSITLKTYADLFDKDLDDVGKRLNDLRLAHVAQPLKDI